MPVPSDEPDVASGHHGRRRTRRRGPLRRWVDAHEGTGPRRAGLVAAVTGGVAVLLVLGLVVFLIVRPGGGGNGTSAGTDSTTVARLDDSDAAQGFVAGATSDIAAVTGYSYDTLPSDLANGETVTTGTYRERYRSALSGSSAATIRRLHRTQTFQLAVAGIGAMSGDTAHVLFFGTQSVHDDTTHGDTDDSLVTLDATVVRSGDQYLISNLDADGNAGLPPGTQALSDAAEAAREEVANLLTLRRAHLDADIDNALALAVDPLHSRLAAQAPSSRRVLVKGGYDLTGTVTAVAVQSAGGDTVGMLVAATGERTKSGKTSITTDGRYVVTVVRVGADWRVSEITPVAVS